MCNASVSRWAQSRLIQMLVISGFVLFGFGLLGEMVAGVREEQRELLRRIASGR